MIDTWSLAQQQDEAYAKAEFDEFFTKQGWYCTLSDFPAVVGVGETKREAFNHAWGKNMGKLKSQVTEQMENTGMDIHEVLEQRGNRYGEYSDVSDAAQQFKDIVRGRIAWKHMEPYMQESLDMICNKLSCIINGDPYYDDSWRDIAGYAQLVVNELEKTK